MAGPPLLMAFVAPLACDTADGAARGHRGAPGLPSLCAGRQTSADDYRNYAPWRLVSSQSELTRRIARRLGPEYHQ